MKCDICKTKKSKRFCVAINNNICSLCCGSNRNLRKCSYKCEYYPHEKTDRIVIGNPELMQNNNGKVILFAQNCFLPNVFDLLKLVVTKFDIYVLDYSSIRIKIHFFIKVNEFKTKRSVDEIEAYLKDDWKKEDNGVDANLVPLFQIYTKKGGFTGFNANQYELDGRRISILKRSNYLNTFMPYSFNKIEKIQPNEQGMPKYINANVCDGNYFQGKNDTYYCELKFNKEYIFDFKIQYDELSIKENIIPYSFGLFFPFDMIEFKKYNIHKISEITLSNKSLVHLVLPNSGKLFNYSLIPLEGNENCFAAKCGVSYKVDEIFAPFYYDKSSIQLYDLGLANDNKLMCKSLYSDLPFQLGNYESLNSIYDKLYAPIKVNVINNTNQIKKLEIFTTIENLCDELKENVEILPNEFKLISLCPSINLEKKKCISDITKRKSVLTVKCENEVLIDETHEITIFPSNLFVFYLENKEKNWKISLIPHLARYVTPHDLCIRDIFSLASRKIPLRGYNSNNTNVLITEIKTIYETLSEKYELEYVLDSYWYGTDDYKKQSIKLPKEVIADRCGNCMELTLLLVSCYEMLNIDTYIILIPGHAFLGLGLFGGEKLYIESTMIGKRSFEEAINKGREEYDLNFENDNPLKADSQIISIKDSRNLGIYPIE